MPRTTPAPPDLPASVLEITRAERPLTARSVIASTMLGVHPPRLPTQLLVRSGELFGISEGTTRVALSRLAAAGEVVADGDGYRLAGALADRQARQSLSRAGSTGSWDGRWELQVVVAGERAPADRAALRAAVRALRLAQRREGVWLRPDNLGAPYRSSLPDAHAVVVAQCERYEVRPDRDDVALAGELWDLDAWVARAAALHDAVEALTTRLERGELGVLGPAFVVSAAVLRHFQSDPLLPPELLPRGWPGPALRAAYAGYDLAFKQAWRAWFRTQR